MQRISAFDENENRTMQTALMKLEMPDGGTHAKALLTSKGWFARFTWPDWPQEEAGAGTKRVSQFHDAYPQLTPVREGSVKWLSISRGWEADQDSAKTIAGIFNRHFKNKVKWVRSARDPKGQIGAECSVEGVGDFGFQLSWGNRTIEPVRSLSPQHWDALRAAARDVMEWSSHQIQPILDTLKQELQKLYGDRFRGLYVFGSYARPDAGIKLPDSSDLDVALILTNFDNPYEERARFGDIVADLSLEHGIAISVKVIRQDDYEEGKTNFTRVISKYAIPVS